MNESPQQEPEAPASGPIGGERLVIARRAKEISARDIAKELHLDEPIVRALEQNNYELLGGAVFAKGHLRKYAELVGVSADDIIADYYELNRNAGAPPVVGPARKIESGIFPGAWIVGGVVLIIIASIAWWWLTREPAPPVARTEAGALAPFVSDASDAPALDEAPVSAGSVSDSEPTVDMQELPSPEIVLASSAPPVGEPESFVEAASLLPQVRVELSFSGDCWTEVMDASGRRLFFELATAGRVVALSGDEPLRIVLGNSENVDITVDGRDYPIPASTISGGLVRLTVNNQ